MKTALDFARGRSHWRIAVASATALLLGACGGGGSESGSGNTPLTAAPAISGVAAKGLLVGATVEVYTIDSRGFINSEGPIATGTTDNAGQFSFDERPAPGNLLLLTFGGEYVDESDPEPNFDDKRRITLGSEDGFEALLPAGQSTLAITPFAQMVLERARRESAGGTQFIDFFDTLRSRTVTVFGFDPVGELPTDPIFPDAAAALTSRRYAMALGGFANHVNATALTLGLRPDFNVVSVLQSDLLDGRLDGLLDDETLTLSTPSGPQPLPRFDFNQQIQRFRNNNFQQYQATPVVVVDEDTLDDPIVLDNTAPTPGLFTALVAEGELLIVEAPGLLSQADDPDGDDLTVSPTPVSPPQFGNLALGTNGGFSYQHDGSETTQDSFQYEISDGNGGTAIGTATLNIDPVDDPASLDRNLGVVVTRGETVTIGTDVLSASDVDSGPDQIIFEIDTSPNAGILQLRRFDGGESFFETVGGGDSFTQQDLIDNNLRYVSDGQSQAVKDEFDLTLDAADFTVDITINPPDNTAPQVVVNNVLLVNEGETATIDTTVLSATDAEDDDSTLTFSLVATPIEGTLLLGSTELGVGNTFSQGDLQQGLLSYAHSGSESEADEFTFNVTDSVGASSGNTVFELEIRSQNDAPVVLNNNGLTVDENGSGQIVGFESGNLYAEDPDHSSSELTYTLLTIPADGTLTLLGITLQVDSTFTQEDLDEAGITYQHNGAENASDAFRFSLKDPEQAGPDDLTFEITVNPVNDAPEVQINNGIDVGRRGTVDVGPQALTAVDDDSPSSDIVFNVLDAGGCGSFGLDGSPDATSFTQADIDAGLVSFTEDGCNADDIVQASLEVGNPSDVFTSFGFEIRVVEFAVVAVDPAQNASAASRDGDIQITVSEPVDSETVNNASVVIRGAYGGSLPAREVFGAGTTIASEIDAPGVDQRPGERLWVSLTSDVRAQDGTALTPFVYEFRTAVGGTGVGNFTEKSNASAVFEHTLALDAADMDGDGDIDVVSSHPDSGGGEHFHIDVNDGTGNFQPQPNIPGLFPALHLGDVNLDGTVDVVLLQDNGESRSIVFYLNDFEGNLDENALSAFDVDPSTTDFALGDINGDGVLDIVTAQSGQSVRYAVFTGSVGTNLNYQQVASGPGLDLGSEASAVDVALGDIDNDGDLDGMLLGGSILELLTNDGTGLFTSTAPSNTDGQALELADFNGDNIVDALVTGASGSGGAVFTGNGAGDFAARPVFGNGTPGLEAAVGDIDGDGDLDVITVFGTDFEGFARQDATYVNDGTASFAFGQTFNGSGAARSVLLLDADGDLDLDIYAGNVDGGSGFGQGDPQDRVFLNNTPPVANADSATIAEDSTSNEINLVGNDTDADGDDLNILSVSGAEDGATVTIVAGNQSINYAPAPDFFGVDEFSYVVSDGNGGEDIGTVTITVNNQNDAPQFAPRQSFDVDENTPNLTPIGTVLVDDADGDDVQFSIQAGDPEGVFGIDADTGELFVQNQSNLDFESQPSYSLNIAAFDGSTTSNAFIPITVNDVNEPPNAFGGNIGTTDEDTPDSGGPGSVGVNDTDEDGDNFTITAVNGSAANVGAQITLPTGALLTVNADRSYSFDPNGAFDTLADGESANVTFDYTISDGEFSDTDSAFQTVLGVNDAPVAANDAVTTDEDSAVSGDLFANNGNGVDADPDSSFSVTAVNGSPANVGTPFTLPSGAVLLVNTDGTFDYDPTGQYDSLADGESTVETFDYTISDGDLSNTADVDITINGVNDAPVAADDDVSTDEDTVLQGDLFADNGNGVDADPDGSFVVSQVNGSAANVGGTITLPSNALLTVNPDGSFSYDPNGQFDNLAVGETASDGFLYTIDDGSEASSANVVITVTGVNDGPVAADDNVSTDEDSLLSGNLFADNGNGVDADPDGSFAVSAVNGSPANVGTAFTLPSGAQLLVNSDGSFDYDPRDASNDLADGDSEGDTFTYTIDDGDQSDTATVNVTITGLNDAPVANDDSGNTNEDQAVTIDVLANDVDPDNGDGLNPGSVTILQSPANGTITDIDPQSGAITYEPNPDFAGPSDSFGYTVDDNTPGLSPSNVATVTITINPVNDPPSFVLDGNDESVAQDSGPQTVSGKATAIDAGGGPDENGQVVTFLVSNDNNALFESLGQPAIDSSGTLSYEPAAGQSGTANITVQAMDDGGTANGGQDTSGPQTFLIEVVPPNQAPTANAPNEPIRARINSPTPIAGLSVSDPDVGSGFENPNVLVIVEVPEAEGLLQITDPNPGTLAISNNNTPSVTIEGTIADINTAFADPSNVVYQPPFQRSASFTLGLTIDDQDPRGALQGFDFQALNLSVFPLGLANYSLEGTATGANLGRIARGVGDINGDGFDDIATIRNDGSVQNVVVFYGSDNGIATADSLLDGSNGFVVTSSEFGTSGRFGDAIAAGDVNRDGFDDLIIGDPGADIPDEVVRTNAGRIFILFGDSSLPGSNDLVDGGTSARYEFINGVDENGEIGSALAIADLNGDAFADLVVGAPGIQSAPEQLTGAVGIFFGDDEVGVDLNQGGDANPEVIIVGDQDGDRFGASLAAADLNGDGIADLLVGAPNASRLGVNNTGSAYVIAGRSIAAFGQAPSASTLLGINGEGFQYLGSADENAELGRAVAIIGDVNGDDLADILVGEPGVSSVNAVDLNNDGADDNGLAHVVHGTTTTPDGNGGDFVRADLDGLNGFVIAPPSNGGLFFADAVGGGGDINADGLDDFIVGYPAYLGSEGTAQDGKSFVLFGSSLSRPPVVDLNALDGDTGFSVITTDPNGNDERSGEQVGTAGDFNGDGFDDLLVTAPLTDTAGGTVAGAGRAYVIRGGNYAGLPLVRATAGGNANGFSGIDETILGDAGNNQLSGGGDKDLLIGAPGDDLLAYAVGTLTTLRGGNGIDRFTVGGSEDLNLRELNVDNFGHHRRLRGLEAAQLGSLASLTLRAIDVANLTGGKNTLRVDGGAGNTVSTEDAWIPSSVVTINVDGSDEDYQRYTRGGATLLVDVDIDRSGIVTTAKVARASQNPNMSQPGNNTSVLPAVSGNGRYVVFQSQSTNLDDSVTASGSFVQIFRHDLQTGDVVMVSANRQTTPTEGDASSNNACISHSGDLVAFTTSAGNLVPGLVRVQKVVANLSDGTFFIASGIDNGETNDQFNLVNGDCVFSPDERFVFFEGVAGNEISTLQPTAGGHIWRRSLDMPLIEVVSYDLQTDFSYCQSSAGCQGVTSNADGNLVAFAANGDFAGDTNTGLSGFDIVSRDMAAGSFTIEINGSAGTLSARPSLSGDGRLLVFESDEDFGLGTNTDIDVFVLDRSTGLIGLVNADNNGISDQNSGIAGSAPTRNGSGDPVISGDGRFVAFTGEQNGLDGVDHPTAGAETLFIKELPSNITSGGLSGRVFRAYRNPGAGFYNRANSNQGAGAFPAIDFAGRTVGFVAVSDNIVPPITDGTAHTYALANPLFEPELLADLDNDQIPDGIELAQLGTNPAARDTDRDNLSDGLETGFDGQVNNFTPGVDTDPNDPDTDGDGAGDGLEFELAGGSPATALNGNTKVFFVASTAFGGGSGSSFADPFTVQEANGITDNGASNDPVIILYRAGDYFGPGIEITGGDQRAYVGSVGPTVFTPQSPPTTRIDVDSQSGSVRGLTVDSGSNMTVRNFRFGNGNAGVEDGPGGGVAVGNEARVVNLTLQSLTIASNFASDTHGGGLAVSNSSTAALIDSVVEFNNVDRFGQSPGAGLGGGVYVNGTSTDLQIVDSVIRSNNLNGSTESELFGGGIAVELGAMVTLDGSEVSEHSSANSGGAIYASTGATLNVFDSVIRDNATQQFGFGTSSARGGAVWMNNINSALFEDVTVADNRAFAPFDASALGGGLSLTNGGTLTVRNSDIVGNLARGGGTSSTSLGGGIYAGFSGNNVFIEDSLIADNLAISEGFNGAGGGFYTNSTGDLQIIDSYILANEAAQNGGGVWISDGGNSGTSMRLVNNLIAGNRGAAGGGLWSAQNSAQGNNLLIQSNTIAYNQASNANGGGGANVASAAGSTLDLHDNIITANDDDTVGSANAGDDYTGPSTNAPTDLQITYNLLGDQQIGDNAFDTIVQPQWLHGFYLTQNANPLVGLDFGGDGDETRTAADLGHAGLEPNALTAGATTSVQGVVDGGATQNGDNLDIGFHALEASAGAASSIVPVVPLAGDRLFCEFVPPFGNVGVVRVRAVVGTLETNPGQLINVRSTTPGAAFFSRTELDPQGLGDSLLAIRRGAGESLLYFDPNNSSLTDGDDIDLLFYEGTSGNQIGSLTVVYDDFSCAGGS